MPERERPDRRLFQLMKRVSLRGTCTQKHQFCVVAATGHRPIELAIKSVTGKGTGCKRSARALVDRDRSSGLLCLSWEAWIIILLSHVSPAWRFGESGLREMRHARGDAIWTRSRSRFTARSWLST